MGNFNPQNLIAAVLIVVVILTIIGLIFREVVCWYWKINKQIALLTDIRDALVARDRKGEA